MFSWMGFDLNEPFLFPSKHLKHVVHGGIDLAYPNRPLPAF